MSIDGEGSTEELSRLYHSVDGTGSEDSDTEALTLSNSAFVTPVKLNESIAGTVNEERLDGTSLIKSNSGKEKEAQLDGSIKFFQNTLSNMRRHASEMFDDKSSVQQAQTFVTEVYHGQMKAIAGLATARMENKGIDCPVGDKWAMLGLGSLGRGEASPFSDLDFAILVDQDTDEVREYFKQYVTEFAAVVAEMHDSGMIMCTGGVVPTYTLSNNDEELETGSKQLLGTPEALSTRALTAAVTGASIGLTDNSLFQADFIHGNSEVMARFTGRFHETLNERMPVAEAERLLPDSAVKRVKKKGPGKAKLSGNTYGEVVGRGMLERGGKFWGELRTVDRVDLPDSKASVLNPPWCDIKSTFLRPIQSTIHGLCLAHGLNESNPLKGIEFLVQEGVLSDELGKDLDELYQNVSGLRVRMELESGTESTKVTRNPKNIFCGERFANAVEISSKTHDMLREGVDTLKQLRKVQDEFMQG